MSLRVEQLESRCTPSAVSYHGDIIAVDDATGGIAWTHTPDHGFRGRWQVAPADDDPTDLLAVAGEGGGPRGIRIDGQTRAMEWSRFLTPDGKDDGYRGGLSLSALALYRSPLQAQSHATVPGNPMWVQNSLNFIPREPAQLLASTGYRVVVFGGTGGVTSLPEFSEYIGRPINQPGTGGATWDSVLAASFGSTTFIRQDQTARVVREAGVALWNRLSEADKAEWRAYHATATWDTDVLRLNEIEAFGESFGWWVNANRDDSGFFGRRWAR